MELAIFLIFGALALGSALVVILHRDPVKSTLSLVVTLFSTAVLFLLLGAPFLGVLQVLVYTGAIVVLFLFVVMLLNLPREQRSESGGRMQRLLAILASLAFVLTGGLAVWRSAAGTGVGALQESFVSLHGFSTELFDRFLLPFEIIGLLLLVAVIAAYVLAKRPEPSEVPDPPEPSRSPERETTTPEEATR